MKQLGVAIIGAGGISEAHAEGFQQFGDNVKVMAFTDIDIDRAKSRAEQYNAPIATVDYKELLDRDDIHIISICSPPFHHYETIINSLKAGKHVLCEKPIVFSLQQLDEIEKLVQKTGLCFGGAFNGVLELLCNRQKIYLTTGCLEKQFMFQIRCYGTELRNILMLTGEVPGKSPAVALYLHWLAMVWMLLCGLLGIFHLFLLN